MCETWHSLRARSPGSAARTPWRACTQAKHGRNRCVYCSLHVSTQAGLHSMVDATKKVASKHLIAMVAVRGLKFSVFLSVYKITLLPSFLFLFRPCQQLRTDSATKKSCSLWFIWKAHLNFYTWNWYRGASHKFESLSESVNLVTWTTTYPSPKSTLTLTSHLGQNCDLREDQVVTRHRMLFQKN